MNLECD